MANNYLSDRGPSFRKETIKLKPIPAYTFSKTLADEFKAKEITKSEVSDLYESMLVIREFEDMTTSAAPAHTKSSAITTTAGRPTSPSGRRRPHRASARC